MVLFEVPTGVVADTAGRRRSYLLGTATLSVSTLLYLAAVAGCTRRFWGWAVASVLLGLGFTFFSGRDRGVARRRAHRDGLHRASSSRLRPGPGRRGRRDAGRLGLRRRHRRSRRTSACRSSCAAILLGDVRRSRSGSCTTSGSRRSGAVGRSPRCARSSRPRRRYGLRNPPVRWLMLAAAVHRRGRHLRVLRPPAVPARALRRPERLRGRRAGRRDRRRRADRRRASRRRASGACSAAGPVALLIDGALERRHAGPHRR